jgi:hypothetical protein
MEQTTNNTKKQQKESDKHADFSVSSSRPDCGSRASEGQEREIGENTVLSFK